MVPPTWDVWPERLHDPARGVSGSTTGRGRQRRATPHGRYGSQRGKAPSVASCVSPEPLIPMTQMPPETGWLWLRSAQRR